MSVRMSAIIDVVGAVMSRRFVYGMVRLVIKWWEKQYSSVNAVVSSRDCLPSFMVSHGFRFIRSRLYGINTNVMIMLKG